MRLAVRPSRSDRGGWPPGDRAFEPGPPGLARRPYDVQVAHTGRLTGAAALAVVALWTLLGAATASAHYSSGIFAPDPSSGPIGTHLVLHGLLHAEPHPITLRWDSAGGPSLGAVTVDPGGQSYSAHVTIPYATAGVHLIVLVAGDQQVADTAFEVTPVASQTPTAVQPAGGSSSWNLAIWLLVPVGIRAVAVGVRHRRRRRHAP